MESFHVYLQEVCLYLNFEQVRDEIIRVCKDWRDLINSEAYLGYWIRSLLGINFESPITEFRGLLRNTKKNKVLNFAAWKTDGGISHVEINSSYKNMWSYNCSIYSTYYSTSESFPLVKNINCLGAFEGGYQRKSKFNKYYNTDVNNILFGNTIDKYKIEKFDQKKCLSLDPLNKNPIENYEDIPLNNFIVEQNLDPELCKNPVYFPVNPAETSALVTKIAISRPFLYTGPVKTLLLIANKSFQDCSFQDFSTFNDISDLESACYTGKVKKITSNEDFEIVEYHKAQGFYPLLWVKFKQCGVNHLEYELSQAHLISVVNCKFFEIDDRREDWNLDSYQPNFDILYMVLIGKEISIN